MFYFSLRPRDLHTLFAYECWKFDTLFSDFSRFWYPKRDTRVSRLHLKNIPFLRVFIDAHGVHASMAVTPPGKN